MIAIPNITVGKKLAPSVASRIGSPISRVDGKAKVTGDAKYAGEFNVPGLCYGYIVNSTIARGRIIKINAEKALALEGVLHVFTHENRPDLAYFSRKWRDDDAPAGSPFRPLYDAEIQFSGQPIALVVAETFELARYASSIIEIEYEATSHETDLQIQQAAAREPKKGKGGFEPPPKPRGDAQKALSEAEVRIDAEYHTPTEHHNPLEMFASTVIVEPDGTLTIYDKTQGAINSQTFVCNVFGLAKPQVRVLSPFVGGAFGSGLRPQHQLVLATMAAMELKRSVRVTMTRQQMFTFGHRPDTLHKLSLGATRDGKLTALKQSAISETSRFEDYVEIVVNWAGELYQCENVLLEYKIAPMDVFTPLDMRAPGAVWGVYALECAIDELAAKLQMDPIEFRLKNYAEKDQNADKPYSSKALKECFAQGASKFDWSRRSNIPRSHRNGKKLIGHGMASGIWDAMQGQAQARATLAMGNHLTVSSCTADIGTGTYTIMSQIAADILGLPIDKVTAKLGDSSLPMAPIEGGSWTAATVGNAVKAACDEIGAELFKLSWALSDELKAAELKDVEFVDETIRLRDKPTVAVRIIDAMRAGKTSMIEKTVHSLPNYVKLHPYTRRTHSAVFVEVEVDEDYGKVEVKRMVSAIAAGRILNPKTAGSQVMGAAVWGISMALHEETLTDHKLGRYMNHNLSEYHVPVNKDVEQIDVIFVKEEDEIINALGVKGVGEIGLVGAAAAVANAVYNATGKRVRDLPLTLDKLID